jgi:hypothetical protein
MRKIPSIYFEAEAPTAKENETRRVDSETSNGQLF